MLSGRDAEDLLAGLSNFASDDGTSSREVIVSAPRGWGASSVPVEQEVIVCRVP